ncbi:MAG: hypothetical protein HY002_05275 [Candidatus Rokubacteria bacterium]|nr:hypothetical protein [Candidatus Rokubacteria bacterium]
MTAADLAARLGAKRRGEWFDARCPGHDDRHASLSFRDGDRGVIVKCHSGCTVEQIAAGFGCRVADLFADSGAGHPSRRGEGGVSISPNTAATMQPVQPPAGCTLGQYATAKRLPVDFLRTLGLRDMSYLGGPAVRVPYFDLAGTEVAVRIRTALKQAERGGDRFRWRRGDRPLPYGLWRLGDAREPGYVVLTEGESDAHTLWFHDLPALGLPGAASWREAWAEALEGIGVVYVVIEPDRGGDAVRGWLRTSRLRARARLLTLDGAKDPSALYLADPDRFPDRWRAALEAAVPWTEEAATAAHRQGQAAWARCAELARAPRILDRFEEDLRRRGVVGEGRAAKLLYLAVVSRLLGRPLAVAVKGPSSAGKNFVSEGVTAFFPPSAYYALSAMSERALVYSEEPLSHRVLVIYELAGLSSDFASYLVRSLLSEGRVRYETVERTKDGLRPRLVEREGPTGLLVTTTAVKLHDETETRLLSVGVTDTPDQTRAVMREHARRRTTRQAPAVDLEPWHALQEWLLTAEHRVSIPFAERLAGLIPPVAVRLRRDFGAILTLIEAHALLHQATRPRDAGGAILATLEEDYRTVRDLVAELVAEGVEATVSPTIRATIEAVRALGATEAGGVTKAAVARALKLDKSAAWRRVGVALDRGYLKNLETREGCPGRLVLGEPLPEEQVILPPADDPRLQGCTVARETEERDTPPSPSGHSDACDCRECIPPDPESA